MTITKEYLSDSLSEDWKCIPKLFEESYWNTIVSTLNSGEFYPKKEQIFSALNDLKPENVKVVIIGQDPYPTCGNAIGYSFSVPNNVKIPGSLKNIFKELRRSYLLPEKESKSGNLQEWVNEGVLLLNSILTVSPRKPLSHKDIGWEKFTNSIIEHIVKNNKNCIFLAWGNYAQNICKNIQKSNKHMTILEAPHPSPINTTRSFVGCNIFIETNKILIRRNLRPIRWLKVFK